MPLEVKLEQEIRRKKDICLRKQHEQMQGLRKCITWKDVWYSGTEGWGEEDRAAAKDGSTGGGWYARGKSIDVRQLSFKFCLYP